MRVTREKIEELFVGSETAYDVVELTVEEARAIETGNDKFDVALDENQGYVFDGTEPDAYVIIRISQAGA